jgi:hypothetical protein
MESQAQSLILVTPATQEAVQGKPKQKVSKISSQQQS